MALHGWQAAAWAVGLVRGTAGSGGDAVGRAGVARALGLRVDRVPLRPAGGRQAGGSPVARKGEGRSGGSSMARGVWASRKRQDGQAAPQHLSYTQCLSL